MTPCGQLVHLRACTVTVLPQLQRRCAALVSTRSSPHPEPHLLLVEKPQSQGRTQGSGCLCALAVRTHKAVLGAAGVEGGAGKTSEWGLPWCRGGDFHPRTGVSGLALQVLKGFPIVTSLGASRWEVMWNRGVWEAVSSPGVELSWRVKVSSGGGPQGWC